MGGVKSIIPEYSHLEHPEIDELYLPEKFSGQPRSYPIRLFHRTMWTPSRVETHPKQQIFSLEKAALCPGFKT